MSLCIFEDRGYRNLLPLTYTRPVSSLRCGILLLQEKVARRYPKARISLFCREYIAEALKGRNGFGINPASLGKERALFLNARLLMEETIPVEGKDEIGIADDTVVYARLSFENAHPIKIIIT